VSFCSPPPLVPRPTKTFAKRVPSCKMSLRLFEFCIESAQWAANCSSKPFALISTRSNLPNNAHFSGGILTNANWLGPVFKFPPSPFPINHRHETVEVVRDGFGVTVFHPDTEPRRMLALIGAGGWFAHFTRSLGCGPIFTVSVK
jgi:hypothetical protein